MLLFPPTLPTFASFFCFFAFFHSVTLTEKAVLHLLARLLYIRQSMQEQTSLKQFLCWGPAASLSHYTSLSHHISKEECYLPLPCVLQHNGSGNKNLQASKVES